VRQACSGWAVSAVVLRTAFCRQRRLRQPSAASLQYGDELLVPERSAWHQRHYHAGVPHLLPFASLCLWCRVRRLRTAGASTRCFFDMPYCLTLCISGALLSIPGYYTFSCAVLVCRTSLFFVFFLLSVPAIPSPPGLPVSSRTASLTMALAALPTTFCGTFAFLLMDAGWFSKGCATLGRCEQDELRLQL